MRARAGWLHMFSCPDCEPASNLAQANSECEETTISATRLRPAVAGQRRDTRSIRANINLPKESVPSADDSAGPLLLRFGCHPPRPGARKSQPRTPILNLPPGVARH